MPRKAKQPPVHPALRTLGQRVRRLRAAANLSQEALADRAGFGRSYMSGIERGVRNPSALQLLKLARALQISVGDLFGD